MPNILTLRVALRNSKPPIWRKIEIDDSMTFEQLHLVIQGAMGWHNCHLYNFNIGRYISIERDAEGLKLGEEIFDESYLASKVKLSDFMTKVGEKFLYTYDFGDDWQVEITVKAIATKKVGQKKVSCVSGKRSGPPEDCGGIWGYYNLLEILEDENHPDYEVMIEWIREDFDPEYFNLAEINKRLEKFNKIKRVHTGGKGGIWVLDPKKKLKKKKSKRKS